MSDRIDWIIPSGIDNPGWIIPTAAWSTGVAFQFFSAAREWWSNREARQQLRQSESSDWKKVMRGEVKREFRLWLERRCCPYSRVGCHFHVRTLLANNDEDTTCAFMVVEHPMPNNANRFSTVLRQYSIFSPNVYTDVAEVINQSEPMESGWWPMIDTQLDDRTLAVVFKRRTLDRMCVILIGVEQKSVRLLKFTSPPGIDKVLFVCRDENRKNRLRIVYGLQEWNRQEVITVDYEIHPSVIDSSRLIALEVGNQSITIPGDRECVRLVVPPGVLHLRSSHPTVQSLALIFDPRGNYQIDSYDVWSKIFEASILGRQWSKARADFDSLLPESQREGARYAMIQEKLLRAVCADGVVQRQLNVPSLKFLAAEAICRGANPGADLSMIKGETGIDIFDGIIESREKPTPTIRLIPNDEDGL